MNRETLYVPLQTTAPGALRIKPPSHRPARAEQVRAERLSRMRHPFASTVRVARQDARRLVLEAPANWGMVGLAIAFLTAAYTLGLWTLANGAMTLDARDTFLMGIMVLVLLHVALRYLVAPLGGEQTLAFDRTLGQVSLTTRGLFGDQVMRYALRDVVKAHVNRVDDGIYDPGTMLVIFRGGGTLQFPGQPGVPKRVEAACDALSRFLAVPRSDRPGKGARPFPQVRALASVDTLDLDELALESWLAEHPASGRMG